jgi:predicted nucleic acid-binding protein
LTVRRALALERHADLILVDERIGRRVAMALGLRVTGLLGVLAEAKRAGLIERVKPFIEDLAGTCRVLDQRRACR